MTNEEFATKIQNGEQSLLTDLWEQNTGIIRIMASRLFLLYRDRCTSSGVDINDIIQICFFALHDAVQAYSTESDYKLLAYIKYPLMNRFRVLVGLRGKRDPLDQCGSLNEIIGDDDDTERLDMLVDPDSAKPFEAVIEYLFQSQLHGALENSLSKLPEDFAAVIRRKYFEGKSQMQIADEMDITYQDVYALERKAFRIMWKDKALQLFRDEILLNMAYMHTGLQRFKETWTSSVERAVFHAEELTVKRGNKQ